jgi:hypothetical protein
VKGESTVAAVRGGEGVFSRFLFGSASEDLRKSMNEVLPQFLAPMTRMLFNGLVFCIFLVLETYLNGVGSFRLRTRRGLLMPVAVLIALLA